EGLLSLTVEGPDGDVIAEVNRARPFDTARELKLAVPRPLRLSAAGDANAGTPKRKAQAGDDIPAGAPGKFPADELTVPTLTVVLATDKARFEGHSEMGEFVEAYAKLEQRRASDERTYVLAFAVLLGLTILSAMGVG